MVNVKLQILDPAYIRLPGEAICAVTDAHFGVMLVVISATQEKKHSEDGKKRNH